mmetsp:Transcript_20017/g.39335  ORF Transcript_20017/g.39335 Transcript_20017/m.39335 type:complete len:207 (-) Transcript_20017:955-1575(-)
MSLLLALMLTLPELLWMVWSELHVLDAPLFVRFINLPKTSSLSLITCCFYDAVAKWFTLENLVISRKVCSSICKIFLELHQCRMHAITPQITCWRQLELVPEWSLLWIMLTSTTLARSVSTTRRKSRHLLQRTLRSVQRLFLRINLPAILRPSSVSYRCVGSVPTGATPHIMQRVSLLLSLSLSSLVSPFTRRVRICRAPKMRRVL